MSGKNYIAIKDNARVVTNDPNDAEYWLDRAQVAEQRVSALEDILIDLLDGLDADNDVSSNEWEARIKSARYIIKDPMFADWYKIKLLEEQRDEARKWARKFYYQREDWKATAKRHLRNEIYWIERTEAAEQRVKELESIGEDEE